MGTEEGRGWQNLNSCGRCFVQGQPSLPGVAIASASDLSLRPEPAEAWVLPSAPSGSAIQGPVNPLWGHREACRGWSLGPDSAHPGLWPSQCLLATGTLQGPRSPGTSSAPSGSGSVSCPTPFPVATCTCFSGLAQSLQSTGCLFPGVASPYLPGSCWPWPEGTEFIVNSSASLIHSTPKTIAAKSTREGPGLGSRVWPSLLCDLASLCDLELVTYPLHFCFLIGKMRAFYLFITPALYLFPRHTHTHSQTLSLSLSLCS